VYISGTVTFAGDATISAYNDVPGNLKIYQSGTGSFGTSTANNATITADILAPQVDFAVKNNALLRGRMIFGTILVKNNLDYYYDTTLNPVYVLKASGVSIVK
jgi:hypothetical protein